MNKISNRGEQFLTVPSLEHEFKSNQGRLTQQPIPIRLLQIMGEQQRFDGIHQLMRTAGVDNMVDLKNYFRKIGHEPEESHSSERKQFYTLVQKVVHKVAAKYFDEKKDVHILELGAGFPGHNAQSYLTSLFPPALQPAILSTDEDPKALKAAKDQNFKRFRQLDAAKLSNMFPKGSFEKVIASCFLDTLTKNDLKKVLVQIRDALKDGGAFVHFSDIAPYMNIFVNHNVNPKTMAFPLTDQHAKIIGLQMIDQDVYNNVLRKELVKKASNIEIQFLDWYRGLDNIEREYMLSFIWEFGVSQQISDWIKNIIPQDKIKIVSRHQFFQDHVKEGLKDSGLDVVEMDYAVEEECTADAGEKIKNLGGNLVVYNHAGKEVSPVQRPA